MLRSPTAPLELLPAPTTETTKVQYLARLVPIQARLDAQLAAITAPRAKAAAYADLIHALQRGLEADSRELDDIQAGDLSNMTVQLRRFERLESKAGRQSRALGLRECS